MAGRWCGVGKNGEGNRESEYRGGRDDIVVSSAIQVILGIRLLQVAVISSLEKLLRSNGLITGGTRGCDRNNEQNLEF